MPKRRAISILLLIPLMYPISYLVVSRNGGFVPDLRATLAYANEWNRQFDPNNLKSGEHLFPPSIWRWNPLLQQKPVNENAKEVLRRFYNPLIYLDRKLWHPNLKRFPKSPSYTPAPPDIPAIPFPVVSDSDTFSS
jgi:hypothetical protein